MRNQLKTALHRGLQAPEDVHLLVKPTVYAFSICTRNDNNGSYGEWTPFGSKEDRAGESISVLLCMGQQSLCVCG